MTDDFQQLDYLSLQTLFIDKNKTFTEALRLRKPLPELQMIYNELNGIYKLIKEKRLVSQKSVSA